MHASRNLKTKLSDIFDLNGRSLENQHKKLWNAKTEDKMNWNKSDWVGRKETNSRFKSNKHKYKHK